MRFLVMIWTVLIFSAAALGAGNGLPPGFLLHPETFGGEGGGENQEERFSLSHYPVIIVSDNRCDPRDQMTDAALGPLCAPCDLVGRFSQAGFTPIELWLLRIGPPGQPMQSLELHTDDLRRFVFSVLKYTGASKVQLVADGAGAVLSHLALKKYNLYNLVHAAVYFDGPFHGSKACDWLRCMDQEPLCCSLTSGSNLLKDLLLPDQTPYSAVYEKHFREPQVKYLTISDGRIGGKWSGENKDSPKLLGARNVTLRVPEPTTLRCSAEAASIYLPFLSDQTATCDKDNDQDGDGFCEVGVGGNDCNDADSAVYPGAEEVCEDSRDQDCNGYDFACKGGRDVPLKSSNSDQH